MSMQHWTKVVSENKPPGRSNHTACCIAGPLTGQEHPLLMVVGGLGDGWEVLCSEVGMVYQIVYPISMQTAVTTCPHP